MGSKRTSTPLKKLFAWVRRQSTKVKTCLAVALVVGVLAVLRLLVRDHNHFFVAAAAIHFIGISILIHKITNQKSCSGLSLRTQELTAIFLFARLCCTFFMEGDIHTILVFATLVSTLWVIYKIRVELKSTYTAKLDNMPLYYVAIPSAILSLFFYPYTEHSRIGRMLWAFAVYTESVSVLPQLLMLQNAKMIEPFTAHYVFALGISRFLGCAHWIIQLYENGGAYLYLVGAGYFWIVMVLLAELVQTFILADFCYYYVKSFMNGRMLVSLNTPV